MSLIQCCAHHRRLDYAPERSHEGSALHLYPSSLLKDCVYPNSNSSNIINRSPEFPEPRWENTEKCASGKFLKPPVSYGPFYKWEN